MIDLLIRKQGGAIVETQGEEERRHTSYLDTPQFALRQGGFALRLREEANGFQINLKFRGSDRYISAAQDLSGSQKGKIKFEEDILPPFVSKFSHSKLHPDQHEAGLKDHQGRRLPVSGISASRY